MGTQQVLSKWWFRDGYEACSEMIAETLTNLVFICPRYQTYLQRQRTIVCVH
jgi:hypothetical protein